MKLHILVGKLVRLMVKLFLALTSESEGSAADLEAWEDVFHNHLNQPSNLSIQTLPLFLL